MKLPFALKDRARRVKEALSAGSNRAHCRAVAMKKRKKTIAFPRRTWQINPSTRVVESAKKYSRARLKRTEALLRDPGQ